MLLGFLGPKLFEVGDWVMVLVPSRGLGLGNKVLIGFKPRPPNFGSKPSSRPAGDELKLTRRIAAESLREQANQDEAVTKKDR